MEVLNTSEVANYLRVSKSTIQKLVKNNKIPFFRVAYRLYFNKASLDEWIKRQEADHLQKSELSQHEIRSKKKDIMPTIC